MYGQHTGGKATTKHRSLVGRGGKRDFVQDKASPKKSLSTPISKTSKKIFEQIPESFQQSY